MDTLDRREDEIVKLKAQLKRLRAKNRRLREQVKAYEREKYWMKHLFASQPKTPNPRPIVSIVWPPVRTTTTAGAE